eukprot:SAG31_NODE_8476_length_1444_cov_1.393309_2_plen_91_part_00
MTVQRLFQNSQNLLTCVRIVLTNFRWQADSHTFPCFAKRIQECCLSIKVLRILAEMYAERDKDASDIERWRGCIFGTKPMLTWSHVAWMS